MVGGISVTGSANNPSPGVNAGLQGGAGPGAQAGMSEDGGFLEIGYVSPGASLTGFWVWELLPWNMSEEDYNRLMEESFHQKVQLCDENGQNANISIEYEEGPNGPEIIVTSTMLDGDQDYVWVPSPHVIENQ
jgi:hypothetical protein